VFMKVCGEEGKGDEAKRETQELESKRLAMRRYQVVAFSTRRLFTKKITPSSSRLSSILSSLCPQLFINIYSPLKCIYNSSSDTETQCMIFKYIPEIESSK